jgi:hypothetical protein
MVVVMSVMMVVNLTGEKLHRVSIFNTSKKKMQAGRLKDAGRSMPGKNI